MDASTPALNLQPAMPQGLTPVDMLALSQQTQKAQQVALASPKQSGKTDTVELSQGAQPQDDILKLRRVEKSEDPEEFSPTVTVNELMHTVRDQMVPAYQSKGGDLAAMAKKFTSTLLEHADNEDFMKETLRYFMEELANLPDKLCPSGLKIMLLSTMTENSKLRDFLVSGDKGLVALRNMIIMDCAGDSADPFTTGFLEFASAEGGEFSSSDFDKLKAHFETFGYKNSMKAFASTCSRLLSKDMRTSELSDGIKIRNFLEKTEGGLNFFTDVVNVCMLGKSAVKLGYKGLKLLFKPGQKFVQNVKLLNGAVGEQGKKTLNTLKGLIETRGASIEKYKAARAVLNEQIKAAKRAGGDLTALKAQLATCSDRITTLSKLYWDAVKKALPYKHALLRFGGPSLTWLGLQGATVAGLTMIPDAADAAIEEADKMTRRAGHDDVVDAVTETVSKERPFMSQGIKIAGNIFSAVTGAGSSAASYVSEASGKLAEGVPHFASSAATATAGALKSTSDVLSETSDLAKEASNKPEATEEKEKRIASEADDLYARLDKEEAPERFDTGDWVDMGWKGLSIASSLGTGPVGLLNIGANVAGFTIDRVLDSYEKDDGIAVQLAQNSSTSDKIDNSFEDFMGKQKTDGVQSQLYAELKSALGAGDTSITEAKDRKADTGETSEGETTRTAGAFDWLPEYQLLS